MAPVVFDTTPWVKKVVAGRFTRSGRHDLAILCWETGGRCKVGTAEYGKGFMVQPFLNATTPGSVGATFVPAPRIELTDDRYRFFPMYPSDIAVGDIDGDGLDDIVVANAHLDRLFIYISRGDGTFRSPIEVTDTGSDDVCYVALGNFAGNGRLDIAVLHTARVHPAPGKNLAFTFSFLFSNGDGTFAPPVKQDLGKWSVPDAEDGGVYYHGSHFNFFTMKNSVQVSGRFRDAVAMGTAMRWWSGAKIDGPDHPARQLGTSLGQHGMVYYNPPRADMALFGGRVTRTSVALPADFPMTAASNTDNLDAAWLGRSGRGITLDCSGIHVIAEDFDRDGKLDILLFSDSFYDGSRYVSQDRDFFLAYGKDHVTNPLDLASPAPELDRLRYFEGPEGGGYRGHRPWRAVVADFDGDGYPDIVLSTRAGLVLFTNQGTRPRQSAPPRILQHYVLPTHTPSDPWYGDSLYFQVQTFDHLTVKAAVFRPVADPARGYVVLMPQFSATLGSVTIPDDDRLPPGDYHVYVSNGVVESSNFVKVKVLLRPLSIRTAQWLGVNEKDNFDRLALGGFFGSQRDCHRTTFELQSRATPPPPPINLLETKKTEEEKAVRWLLVSTPPGPYELVVRHPVRGTATTFVTVADYSPRLVFVHWNNSDSTWGEYDEKATPQVYGAPIKPGARVEVHGSFLYAHETTKWELLDAAGGVFASGTGQTARLGLGVDNNRKGAFIFLPGSGLPNSGRDLRLRLTTEMGLQSNRVGPLGTGKLIVDPMLPLWWIGVEYLDGGKTGYCGYPAYYAKEYNQPDPTKAPGALQQARWVFPGNYEFTELTPSEAAIRLCYDRRWDIQAQKADGSTYSVVETAITEKRAIVNFNDIYAPDTIISIKKRDRDP